MMIKQMFYFITFASTLLFTSCQKDEDIVVDPGESSGKLVLEITDAPIDQANVAAAFVTIADLKLDGQSVTGFQKISINLLDLQNGVTQALGNITLPEKSYEKISLVLDHESDAQGNSPGSYIQLIDSSKQALVSTMNEVEASYDFDIAQDSTTTLVLDFDLRKSIQLTNSTDSTKQFAWTTANNFNDALRIISKDNASTITGYCDKGSTTADQIVAFLYEKGSFDSNAEIDTSNQEVMFSHAITSTLVEENGDYGLHFINPGQYEIHFAAFTADSLSHELNFNGLLEINTSSAIDLTDITLEAGAETTIDLSVTGLLNL
ncbi:DUF4382 domain-containing protein [Membranihabitans marinus]|uniref:DUF4382 domain-containing protein n=1 Tax=Membranihabitans marinus TaxID=1227546 RepID=UPI001F1E1026|nr:DUF4382 domain-containing protein [Membranihabitans marinus]